jgi:hypothetical protein
VPTRKDRLRSNPRAYARYDKATDRPVLVAQLVWIPVVVVPLFFDLGPTVSDVLSALDIAFWLLFAVHYLTGLFLCPSKRRYVTEHLLDLALVALWMLPIVTVPRSAAFLRTTLGLRLLPLLGSGGQRFARTVGRRRVRPGTRKR